jgi:hypothetical protein
MKTTLTFVLILIVSSSFGQFSRSLFMNSASSDSYKLQSNLCKHGANYFYGAVTAKSAGVTKFVFGNYNKFGDLLSYDSLDITHALAVSRTNIMSLFESDPNTITMSLMEQTPGGYSLSVYRIDPNAIIPIISSHTYTSSVNRNSSEGFLSGEELIHYVSTTAGLKRISFNLTTSVFQSELVEAGYTLAFGATMISCATFGNIEYAQTASGSNGRLFKRTSSNLYTSIITNSHLSNEVNIVMDASNNVIRHYLNTSNYYIDKYDPNLNLISTTGLPSTNMLSTVAGSPLSFFKEGNNYYRAIDFNAVEKFDPNLNLIATIPSESCGFRKNKIGSDFLFGGQYKATIGNLVGLDGVSRISSSIPFFSFSTSSIFSVCEDMVTQLNFDQTSILQNDGGADIQSNSGISSSSIGGLKFQTVNKAKSIYTSTFCYTGKIGLSTLGTSEIFSNRELYGPFTNTADYTMLDYHAYNNGFYVSKDMISQHLLNIQQATPNYRAPHGIHNWPGNGDVSKGQSAQLAKFVDVDNDGVYEPYDGDYPRFYGDHCVLSIVHDNTSWANGLGIEIHKYAYYFDCEDDALTDNVLFIKRELYARESNITSFKTGVFVDFDLGDGTDDLIETDVTNSLIYVYNGDGYDLTTVSTPGYGTNIPSSGLTVLRGTKLYDDLSDNSIGIGSNQSPNGYGFGNGTIDDEFLGLEFSNFSKNSGTGPITNFDPNNVTEITNYLDGLNGFGTPTANGGIINRYVNSATSDPLFYGSNGLASVNPLCLESGDYRMVAGFGTTNLNVNEKLVFDYAYLSAYDSTEAQHLTSKDKLIVNTSNLRTAFQNNAIGCASNFDLTDPSLGIKESVPSETMKLYPNPSNGLINIRFNSIDKRTITIYDMQGKLMKTFTTSNLDSVIDLSGNDAGIYVIQTTSSSNTMTSRIVLH